MKNTAKWAWVAFSVCLLAACGAPVDSTMANDAAEAEQATLAELTAADMHAAENSLDFYGVYEGLLPAADGPGIQTTLTLDTDHLFKLVSEYVDREDAVFEEEGAFSLEDNLLTLETEERPTYYKVEEGRVRMLDMDKQPIAGPLAEHYILRQTQTF